MPDPQDKTPPRLSQPSLTALPREEPPPALEKPEETSTWKPQTDSQLPEPPVPSDTVSQTETTSAGKPAPWQTETEEVDKEPNLPLEENASLSPPTTESQTADTTTSPEATPPQPPSLQPTTDLGQVPPAPPAESPELKAPKRGEGFKKLFMLLVIAILALGLGFLVVGIVIPRLKTLKVPGMPGKQTTIKYWGLWEPSAVVDSVIAEFNEENPEIKVEYVQQSHKDYRERLQSAIARGEGPDIFRFHNTWVPMLKDDLDTVPPEVYNASDFQETFYPVVTKDLRRGANFVGIPLETDGLALFVNTKIFRTAGKSPPSTWEELRQAAFDLTIRDTSGRIQTAGVALGTTNNVDHWSDILGLMLLQNGADPTNPTDKLAADALLFYTIFSRSDKVWDESLPNSTQAFATEKVAMYFGPSWRVLDIKALNPEIEFTVHPVPQLPNSNITWASYWVEGVSAKSEQKKQAWEFLKYLSSKAALEKLYAQETATRLIGEPYSRTDMQDLLKDDPYVGAYVLQAPAAQSWYLSSATHDNGINDRIIKYLEDAVNAVNQKADPERSLETASQGITQILSQYGVK